MSRISAWLRVVAGLLFAVGALVMVAGPWPLLSIVAGVIAAFLLWSSRKFLRWTWRQRRIHLISETDQDRHKVRTSIEGRHRPHHVR